MTNGQLIKCMAKEKRRTAWLILRTSHAIRHAKVISKREES
jgi:hypothetical protein